MTTTAIAAFVCPVCGALHDDTRGRRIAGHHAPCDRACPGCTDDLADAEAEARP